MQESPQTLRGWQSTFAYKYFADKEFYNNSLLCYRFPKLSMIMNFNNLICICKISLQRNITETDNRLFHIFLILLCE